MTEITISGYTVQVDDEDVSRITQLAWHINKGIGKGAYFDHGEWDSVLRRPRNISLHRFIMGCAQGDGTVIDHKDRNTLNCQKSNLRICTAGQNSKNQKTRANSSGYKGVDYIARLKRWRTRITVDYKCISLGTYDSPEKAHEAYNKASLKYFGEYSSVTPTQTP